MSMTFICDTHKHGIFITLGTCYERDNFLRWIISHVFYWNNRIFLWFKNTGKTSNFNICFHASSVNNNLLFIFFGSNYNMNNSFNLGGKGSNKKPSRCFFYNLLKVFENHAFGNGKTWP